MTQKWTDKISDSQSLRAAKNIKGPKLVSFFCFLNLY